MKNNGFWITEYLAYHLPWLGSIAFIILNVAAMIIYPGGTYQNSELEYYVFTQNYFSDLGRTLTMGNGSNFYSSFLFNNGLFLIGILTCLFYYYLPNLFTKNRKAHFVSIIGSIIAFTSGISFVGIALTPSNLYLDEHMFFVRWAFRSFLLVAIFYTAAIYQSREWQNRYAVIYIIFAIVLFGYVLVMEFGPNGKGTLKGLIFQVIAQKFVVISFIISVFFKSQGAKEVYYAINKLDP